ncbi:MAG: helix-hairpin-helix domain-containing protein [Lachnospiraceae bacterium]|nr:helix-hairpin-helix domain-containing protein [Lachnospiraceae bacterium]
MKKKKKYYTVVAGLCVMIAGALFLCGRSEAALGRDGVVITLETEQRAGETDGSLDPAEPVLIVHVCGAVRNEGVYRLPAGSRIEDAVIAAGGFLPTADRDYCNLAQPVEDGQQIRVPTRAEAESLRESRRQQNDGLININTAKEEELMQLPGIGQARAQAIIAWREENGGFQTIEDIMKVPGIKESAFQKIKDRIKTGD